MNNKILKRQLRPNYTGCYDAYGHLICDGDLVAFNYSGEVRLGIVEARVWKGYPKWEFHIRHVDMNGVPFTNERYYYMVKKNYPSGRYRYNSLSKVKSGNLVVLT